MGRDGTEADPSTPADAFSRTQAGLPEIVSAAATGNTAETSTAAGEAKIATRSDEADGLELALTTDIIYHRAREAWLLLLHRFAVFLTIVAGSSAAIDVVNIRAAALIAVISATADVVFDWAGRATAHRDTVRELLAMIADLAKGGYNVETCRRVGAQWIGIGDGGDAAPFHVTRQLAMNQARTALGRQDGHVPVGFWRRMGRHVRRLEGWPDARPVGWAQFWKRASSHGSKPPR